MFRPASFRIIRMTKFLMRSCFFTWSSTFLNSQACFQFIRKHLAPGGVVIMEAPDVDGPWKTIYMIQLSHMHIFSPRTIKNLFLAKGFEVLQVSRLQNELDDSNLFIAGRLGEPPQETPAPRDSQESMRIRSRFQRMPTSRTFLVLRAWVRLAYFALRRE